MGRAVAWLALTETVPFYGAVFWGIAEAGAGLSAVLANPDPLFVAALAAPFLGEALSGRQWTGLGDRPDRCGGGGLGGAAVAAGDLDRAPRWWWWAGRLAWSIGTVTAARGIRGPRPSRSRWPAGR